MASTNFVYGTVIASAWLNDVNAAVYTTLPALSTLSGVVSGHTTAIQTLQTTVQGQNPAGVYATLTARDASGGYAGLTGYSINFKDMTGTYKSSLTNISSAPRTYSFPDKDIVVAGTINETLYKPTIKGYIEQFQTLNPGTTVTINPDNGTLIEVTVTANITITLPAPVAGVCYTLILVYNGAYTVTFAGGGTLKWSGGAVPTATSTAGKIDKYVFVCGTAYTLAQDGGRSF